jgi:hypothetical protein
MLEDPDGRFLSGLLRDAAYYATYSERREFIKGGAVYTLLTWASQILQSPAQKFVMNSVVLVRLKRGSLC